MDQDRRTKFNLIGFHYSSMICIAHAGWDTGYPKLLQTTSMISISTMCTSCPQNTVTEFPAISCIRFTVNMMQELARASVAFCRSKTTSMVHRNITISLCVWLFSCAYTLVLSYKLLTWWQLVWLWWIGGIVMLHGIEAETVLLLSTTGN